MSKPIKVGLIGCGGVAGAHAMAFQAVENTVINAVWNRTKSRAEAFSAQYNLDEAEVCDSWESMIQNGNLDAVAVTTAPQLRAEPVIAALRAGLHVLVEKPFATTLAEADVMTEAAEKADCVTAVCFTYRYRSGFLAARRIIEEGMIGSLSHVSSAWRLSLPSTFSANSRPWAAEGQGGIGYLGEIGSHQFDMIRFLTRTTVNKLAGHLTWFDAESPELRTNRDAHLVGTTEDGVGITYEVTTPPGRVWFDSRQRTYIEGTRGCATIEGGLLDNDDGYVTVRLEHEEEPSEIVPDERESNIERGHSGLASDFVAAIRAGDRSRRSVPHLPTFEDGLLALEFVLGAIEADSRQGWVTIARR